MSSKKYYSSGNNRISIRKFLEDYIGIKYRGEGKKLTHVKMYEIIDEENLKQFQKKKSKKVYSQPVRVNFATITKEDIASGRYLEVIDDRKDILVYKNPLFYSLDQLFNELEEMDKHTLEEIRHKCYLEMGYIFSDEEEGLHRFETKEEYYNEEEFMLERKLKEEEILEIIHIQSIKKSNTKKKKLIKARRTAIQGGMKYDKH